MKTTRLRHAAVAGVLAAATTLSACGGSTNAGGGSDKAINVDVGVAKPIKLQKPLKIAYFNAASSNALGAAQGKLVKQYAKDHHLDITTFDAGFDTNLQFNQIQTAIQSKRYNALAIWPVDGQTICKLASKTAPAANLLVSVFDQPICGRFFNVGDKLWQPGTLNYIAGYDTKQTFEEWFDAIYKTFPSKQTVGVLVGVPTDGDTQKVNANIKRFKTEHPDYDFVAQLNTAYTTETGYQQALAMLHAHPDITMIISGASAISVGAAKALKQLGKAGQVKLVDYGANKQITQLIKDGVVALSVPAMPETEGRYWLQQLQDAANGKSVPRFTGVPFQVITKDNVDKYTPEY